MKKHIMSIISLILVIPFFFTYCIPVFADYDVDLYQVEPWQIIAYEYWNKAGYNFTHTLSNSTNIAIPKYFTDTGNTNYSLICNEDASYPANGSACYYRNNSTGQIYGTWNQYTNVAHNETEENISLRGAEIPWLSGSYRHVTNYDSANGINLFSGRTLYLVFYSTRNLWVNQPNASAPYFFNVYSNNGLDGIIATRKDAIEMGAYRYVFTIENTSQTRWISIDIPGITNTTNIVPYYLGYGNDLSDDIKQKIGINTSTENYLNNISSKIDSLLTLNNTQTQAAVNTNNNLISGNPTSQAAQSALNNSNTTLNNRVDQMNSIETEYNSDLNAALDDIDISTDLVNHTGFTNAALWVSAQFNRLVIGTPFELVITFSLITGLALVLIGKMRG